MYDKLVECECGGTVPYASRDALILYIGTLLAGEAELGRTLFRLL